MKVSGYLSIFFFIVFLFAVLNDFLPMWVDPDWTLRVNEQKPLLQYGYMANWWATNILILFFAVYLGSPSHSRVFTSRIVTVTVIVLVALGLVFGLLFRTQAYFLNWSRPAILTWSIMFLSIYYMASRKVDKRTSFYLALFSTYLASTLYELPHQQFLLKTTGWSFLIYRPQDPLFFSPKILALFFLAHIYLRKGIRASKRIIPYAVTIIGYVCFTVWFTIDLSVGPKSIIPWQLHRAPTAFVFFWLSQIWLGTLPPCCGIFSVKENCSMDEVKNEN